MDSLQPSDEPIPVSVEQEPLLREVKKPNKTQKRVIVLLCLMGAFGVIGFIGNQVGVNKKFIPNVPVAESSAQLEEMTVEPTGETTTEVNSEDTFQPAPDLEVQRNELLDKSLNEVKFQVNNLSEAVAEEFLQQAKVAIEKEPISIELFLIKKINFLANKLDKATLEGEFSGSAKEREKAANLLFEVWGNLLALQKHWDNTAGNQVQLKFTSVNVSVLAQEVRNFSNVAMNLRALTYEQQKRTEALQKQLELEAQKGVKSDGKTK